MRGGYYRPMYLHRVRVAQGDDGLPTAWDHVIVGQSILAGTPFASEFGRQRRRSVLGRGYR